MRKYALHETLKRDSMFITRLGLCELRLMDDARWPWLLLVPQRPQTSEIHDLTPLDQTMLTFEISLTGRVLKEATGCDKLNTAALGNIVPQLHVHIVARSKGDPNWPNPVWGHDARVSYEPAAARKLIASVAGKLQEQ